MQDGGRDIVETRVTLHDKDIVEPVVPQGAIFHIQDGGRERFNGASRRVQQVDRRFGEH